MAKSANGHVFEDRFLQLNGIQLVIAYKQVMKEEEEQFKLIKSINQNWSKKFDNLFKVLFMFTNPKLYGAYEEMKELEDLKAEIKVEEFPEIWSELEQIIPDEVIVEDIQANGSFIPEAAPEIEEYLTGFVSYMSKKEGE